MELCADFYFSRVFSYTSHVDAVAISDEEVCDLFSSGPCGNWISHQSKFEKVRDKLNEVKSRLGKFAEGSKMRSDWHQHTEALHLFSGFSKTVVHYFGAELVTRAWLKMYDILARFPELTETPLQTQQLTSVHLCEAPGAFISALNHRLDSLMKARPPSPSANKAFSWNWFASTLNPYHELSRRNEAIFEDQLIASTPENWLFGVDNTGDITFLPNVLDIWKRVGRQAADLVTSDGAIDCQSNPSEQELTLSLLHFSEVTAAAGLLRPGGHFVIKLFTLFELPTACLVCLLTVMFKRVFTYKPACSKPGNSEIYFICIDYIFRPHLVDKLVERMKLEKPLDNLILNDWFLANHFDCALHFSRFQSEAIERNIGIFEDLRSRELVRFYEKVEAARSNAEMYFIERACAPLYRLSADKHLLKPGPRSYFYLVNKSNKFNFDSDDGRLENKVQITCYSGKLDLNNSSLTVTNGKMPFHWTQTANSLFCSPAKVAQINAASSLLSAVSNNIVVKTGDRKIVFSQSAGLKELLKKVFDELMSLSCKNGEDLWLVGIPPPVTRCLAGILRILLTRFKCVSIDDNGCWHCQNWQGAYSDAEKLSTFDAETIAHLSLASSYCNDKTLGVVEILPLSAIFCDRSFCVSLFNANNHFLTKLIQSTKD